MFWQVYMGAELDERPKQGLVTQTVSKIVMSFAKQVREMFPVTLWEEGWLAGGRRRSNCH